MEQRANINFCFKTGKTATETFQLINHAYGDNALSCTCFFYGIQEFRMAMKISKLLNAVDNQQLFEHLT
jgi:hypothetical protein